MGKQTQKEINTEVDTHRRDMQRERYIRGKTYTKRDTHRGKYTKEEDYTELSINNKDYIKWIILIEYIE